MTKRLYVISDPRSERETCLALSVIESEKKPNFEDHLLVWQDSEAFTKTPAAKAFKYLVGNNIYGLEGSNGAVVGMLQSLDFDQLHFFDYPQKFLTDDIWEKISEMDGVETVMHIGDVDVEPEDIVMVPKKFVFSDKETLKRHLKYITDFDLVQRNMSSNGTISRWKKGILVTFYKTNYNTFDQLKRLLLSLSFTDYFVVLASHSPVPEEIQELCDTFVFESENVADQRKWSHGVAETSLIRKGLKAMKDKGIDWSFKICYDVSVADISVFENWVKGYRYKFVSCLWGEKLVSTNSFFANIDFVLESFSFFDNIEDMFQRSFFIEEIWDRDAREKGLLQEIFTFNTKEEMFGSNKMDTNHFDYSELSFRFDEGSKIFYVDNFTDKIFTGKVSIVDYYTDLAVYTNNFYIGHGSIWIAPNPIFHDNDLPKNGYYLELFDDEGKVLARRNFGINDFGNKVKFHKIHNRIRQGMAKYCLDAKYPELLEFQFKKRYGTFKIKNLGIKTFIDIGAHAGMFTLGLLGIGAKKGYLLEPEPNACALLREAFDVDWVKVIEKAVYKEKGMVELFRFSEFETTNSLNPNWQGKISNSMFVNSISMDDLFGECVEEDEIDLLKIDIEGGEYDAFEGFSDNTMKRCKHILLEYHANENSKIRGIVERLEGNGFLVSFEKWNDFDNDNPMLNDMGIIFAKRDAR